MEVDAAGIRAQGRSVPAGQLVGFAEHYGVFSGRAWLEVVGSRVSVRMGPGYGAVRARIREVFPKVPFDSDWQDGRFPTCPGGLPPGIAWVLGGAVAVAVSVGVAWLLGPWAGLAAAVLCAWPVAHLRDGVVVRADGLRVGPPWAPRLGWHEIDAVCVSSGRRTARVFTRGPRGGGTATVPSVLVPALRARLRRLGGLALEEATPGLDDRYARWRAPAAGVPWGVLAGTVAGVWALPAPWTGLAAGLFCMAGTALLGAMVEARATGWGTGAILWGSALYALVLMALGVGVSVGVGGS